MFKIGLTLLKFSVKMTIAGVVFTLVSNSITKDTYEVLQEMRSIGEL